MANNVLDKCTVRNSAHKDEPVTDTKAIRAAPESPSSKNYRHESPMRHKVLQTGINENN